MGRGPRATAKLAVLVWPCPGLSQRPFGAGSGVDRGRRKCVVLYGIRVDGSYDRFFGRWSMVRRIEFGVTFSAPLQGFAVSCGVVDPGRRTNSLCSFVLALGYRRRRFAAGRAPGWISPRRSAHRGRCCSACRFRGTRLGRLTRGGGHVGWRCTAQVSELGLADGEDAVAVLPGEVGETVVFGFDPFGGVLF